MKYPIERASQLSIYGCRIAALIAFSLIVLQQAKAELTLPVLAAAGDRRDAEVSEVRSVRRYILHNQRWSEDAVAEVLFTVHGTAGASYSILSTNAKGFHREIVKRILDGEVDAWKKRDAEITPANYDATPIGLRTVNGKPCEALKLIPKSKSRYVLDGWVCGDPKETAITHVEGQTARSVSFWVGKIYLSQDFRKIGPYWYSSESRSTADVKFFGKTQLTIQYLDYQITPRKGAALLACRSTGCSPALRGASARLTRVASAAEAESAELASLPEATTLPPAASPLRTLR